MTKAQLKLFIIATIQCFAFLMCIGTVAGISFGMDVNITGLANLIASVGLGLVGPPFIRKLIR